VAETPQQQGSGIKRSTIWIYGSFGFPLAMVGYPLGIWLPRAYDTYVGVETALVGTVMTAAAIFDAITDPPMGYASDKFRTRLGRRRTWVLLGGPFLALAFYFLLNPQQGATVAFLAFWFLFLRLGTTIALVPYGAWGAELSGQYHVRTWIVSAREKFVLLGLMGAAAVPLVVESIHGDDTTALMVLNSYTWLVVPVIPLAALFIVMNVPEPPASVREGKVPLLESFKLMGRNTLFLWIMAIEILITGGEAFRNALSLYFMQDYIGAPRAGTLYFVYFTMGLLAIPFWDWLAKRYAKHISLAGAMIFVSVVSIAIFMLEYGQVWAFYALFALKGFCFGAFAYLPRAMLADVIDVDTARTGDARTGGYFALHGLMTKIAQSFGGIALVMLSIVGYNTARGASHSGGDLLWLGFLYAIVPTVLFGVACYLCLSWPLTPERHAKLRRVLHKLEARRAARQAGAPTEGASEPPLDGVPRPAD